MVLDKVIAEYLKEKGGRLIIPGFGAFIRRGEDEVAFTTLLTVDDGILAAEISRRLGYPSDEAASLAKQYGDELRRRLAIGASVEIKGLGALAMGPGGKYTFSPAGTHSAEKDARDTAAAPAGAAIQTDDAAAGEHSVPGIDTGGDSASGVNVSPQQAPADNAGSISPDKGKTSGKNQSQTRRSGNGEAYKSKTSPPRPGETADHSGDNARENTVGVDEEWAKALRTGPVKPIPLDYNPKVRIRQRSKRKRLDGVMLIAIIAIVIAVAVIVYGRMVESGNTIDLNEVMIIDAAADGANN